MKTTIKDRFILIFIFSALSVIFFFNYQDYGIGIEEHFQRKIGFYWLSQVLSSFSLEELFQEAQRRLNDIETFTPNLFPINEYGYYGVIFDLPMALIETLLKVEEPKNYFFLRHMFSYFFFLISAFYFFKIIELRFKNFFLSIIALLIYCLTPRIFGNSFFDGKDIFFLTVMTINFYCLMKFQNKRTIFNLIIFALFCSFSTSTRIIGILIPISWLFIMFLSSLNSKILKKNLIFIFVFILFYFIFLFLQWPYLWSLEFKNLLDFFDPFFKAMNPIVYFNGDYFQSKYLPLIYLPKWIFLTTPFFYLFMSIFGFYFFFKRIFNRLCALEDNGKEFLQNLWRGQNEKFDFFLILNFTLIFVIYFSKNLALLSGWRHFYFLHFYIVYFSIFTFYLLFLKNNKNLLLRIFGKVILALFLFEMIYKLYIYHPYQSLYFNNLTTYVKKSLFEIDTQSLSRSEALKEILKDGSSIDRKIKIGTASWTPLEDARSLIDKKYWSKFIFLGTANLEDADYIYTNFYYEVDIRYNNKYAIPKQFKLYKTLYIDGIKVYSIFKKKF
jgi:hypothetical protein